MAGGSTLNPSNFPADGEQLNPLKGHDTGALGPSDSSDSGSDVAGGDPTDDDSDRSGTGERAAVGRKRRTRTDTDLDTDRIVNADEAGATGGEGQESVENP